MIILDKSGPLPSKVLTRASISLYINRPRLRTENLTSIHFLPNPLQQSHEGPNIAIKSSVRNTLGTKLLLGHKASAKVDGGENQDRPACSGPQCPSDSHS